MGRLVEASIGERLEMQLWKWNGKCVVGHAISSVCEDVVTNCIGAEGIDAGSRGSGRRNRDQIQGLFKMGEMWSWTKYVQRIDGEWERWIGEGQWAASLVRDDGMDGVWIGTGIEGIVGTMGGWIETG
jgi:hypothetical protein